MHSLETIERLNLEASERELAREYGREHARHDLPGRAGRPRLLPSPDRLRTLRARLLALGAALLAVSCGSAVKGPTVPDVSDPLPPPTHRFALRADLVPLIDGSVAVILHR